MYNAYRHTRRLPESLFIYSFYANRKTIDKAYRYQCIHVQGLERQKLNNFHKTLFTQYTLSFEYRYALYLKLNSMLWPFKKNFFRNKLVQY